MGWVKLEETNHDANVLDFAHMYLPAIPGHAERLLERIDFCLKSGGYTIADVDLIVLGRGPGTFTGLRIGFSCAKALGLANGIPIVLVSTLEMLAHNANETGTVVALLDARRKELFMGVYDVQRNGASLAAAVPRFGEQVVSPDEVNDLLQQYNVELPVQLVGDGAVAYKEKLLSLGAPASPASASLDSYAMAMLGYERFKSEGPCNSAVAEPVYLREPDAKKPKNPMGSPWAQ